MRSTYYPGVCTNPGLINFHCKENTSTQHTCTANNNKGMRQFAEVVSLQGNLCNLKIRGNR